MDAKKQKAGRLGGLATFQKYGKEGMAERGRKGGRPRALILEDIERQQQSQRLKLKEKEEMDTPRALASESLTKLKRLFKLRQKSTGNTK